MNKNIRKSKFHRPDNQPKGKQAREERPETRKKAPENKISNATEKSVRNRCCLVRPKQQDFSHLTQFDFPLRYEEEPTTKSHLSIFTQKYGFDPAKRDSSLAKSDYTSMFATSKIENSSRYKQDFGVDAMKFVETSDGTQWQNIESINDLDKFIQEEPKGPKYNVMSQNVHIAEVPKVKIIAEKFSKFQRDNVELRKLDEKVVCVEYDIFDRKSKSNINKPVQSMRAFFSIKPLYEQEGTENTQLTILPPKIKAQFNVVDEDFNNLTQTEVEIIDETIEENKSYLEDLKRIIKRVEFERVKKDRSSLDLKSMYEMAKRERHLDNNFSVANFLSIKELKEVKNLIMQKCASSVHGMSRKLLKTESKLGSGILSGSILAELFRNNSKQVLE
ncbi:unnamed protein product [Arctia plantaginis]|uniref:Uncharacterized protein n=1 Tax=Arctia plantaginis TaxID=874455 RepID=A0A8S1BDH5_ARCPL|nr:unnamed protein product [Arctia plantaginis]